MSPAVLALFMGILIPGPEQAAYDDLLRQAEAGVDGPLEIAEFGVIVAEMASRTHAPTGARPDPRHERIDLLRRRALARWPDLPTRMAAGFDDTDGRWSRIVWRALTCDHGTGRYGHRHIFGEAVDLLRGIP